MLEQAIAILLNVAPASFTIAPVNDLKIATFTIPKHFRQPYWNAGYRRHGTAHGGANRTIGLKARRVLSQCVVSTRGGFEDEGLQSVLARVNSFWSYGSGVAAAVPRVGTGRNCSSPGLPIVKQKIGTDRPFQRLPGRWRII